MKNEEFDRAFEQIAHEKNAAAVKRNDRILLFNNSDDYFISIIFFTDTEEPDSSL